MFVILDFSFRLEKQVANMLTRLYTHDADCITAYIRSIEPELAQNTQFLSHCHAWMLYTGYGIVHDCVENQFKSLSYH